MAKDLNKVMLIGRLGQDPELKYTPSGIAVATFSIATNSSWKDSNGNIVDKTEWHNIKAWRGIAETCANYLKKGSRIYVEGRLETSSWEDDNKTKRYKTEIVIDNMIMLDSKQQDSKQSYSSAESDENYRESADSSENLNDDLPF